MLKLMGWLGFLGLIAVAIYFLALQGILSIPGISPAPMALQPAPVKTPPPPPAVPPPQAQVIQPPPAPPPPTNPDAGKLRGTKEKDWDHTWVTIQGKKVMAIFNVRLTDSLIVGITNPFGDVLSSVDQLPQGFLDSWGITGDVIDQKVSAIVDQVKAAAQSQAAVAQNKAAAAEAATDAQGVTVGFKVIQVMNKSEILGSVEAGGFGFRIIHISGIDAGNMATDNSYTLKVWPNGVFQYASGPGATADIESYTGVEPGSAH